MGPAWEHSTSDIVRASQGKDDLVRSTARMPSLFRTLVHRQIRPSKVCQLPYEGEWTSDGDKKGGGVLTTQDQACRAPPLSLSFAKKRRDGQMLAVADEEGYVSIFNTDRELPSMADSHFKPWVRTKHWMAHSNAVFDVCWTKDDTHILTASGDQTIRLWDIENKRGVGVMIGHAGSVKSICVHPSVSDVFVSGSRDGCVSFWDLRSQSGSHAGCPKYAPVTKVKDAHKGVMNAKRRKGYTRSVTSVLYLKDERLVATAGANDGVVKFWDTRKLKNPVAHTPSERASSGARMHGIAGLSQDPNGTRLIATCVDSKIYMYDVMALAKGELKTFSGHTMGSFYIKASFSPDGSHILGGSTDHNAYLWKVDRPEESPTILRGHSGEVTAVDWCPMEHCKVATCSDDYTVRVWKVRRPRFSEKPPPKSSTSPSRHPDLQSHMPKHNILQLQLEDSQHPLQSKLQREKKLHVLHTERHLNILGLVEDSQHTLPISHLQFLRTAEDANMDDSHLSSQQESLNEDEMIDEVASESIALTVDSKDSGIHGRSATILHPKRTRVLFRGGDALCSELRECNGEQSASFEENLENTFKASYSGVEGGLGEKQVSPPFKRTRVPLREINRDGEGNKEVQHPSSAAKHFTDYLSENTRSSVDWKRLLGDKPSTPPINRLGVLYSSTTAADSECQVQKPEHESSVGQSNESPSSVLSPPDSTQRRRKTIMDYFSLQPQSTVAHEKTG